MASPWRWIRLAPAVSSSFYLQMWYSCQQSPFLSSKGDLRKEVGPTGCAGPILLGQRGRRKALTGVWLLGGWQRLSTGFALSPRSTQPPTRVRHKHKQPPKVVAAPREHLAPLSRGLWPAWRKSHHIPASCRAVGTASPIGSEGWHVGPCSGNTLPIFHILSGNNQQCWDDFPDTLEGLLQGALVTYVPFKSKKSKAFPCPDPHTIT